MAELQQAPRPAACRIVVILLGSHLSGMPFSLVERLGEERAAADHQVATDPIFVMDWAAPIDAPPQRRTEQQWAQEPHARRRQAAVACFEELLSWTQQVDKSGERHFLTIYLLARGLTAFAQCDLREAVPRAMEMLAANAEADLRAGFPADEPGTTYCHGVEALKLALRHYGDDDHQTWSAFIDEQARRQPPALYTTARHDALKPQTWRLNELP